MASLVDKDFRWDGTTSDLAQQFYRRSLANASARPLQLLTTPLPTAIQSRLDVVGLTFDQLPGLLQRALVWDSGYVITPGYELVRIQTLNGVSMAEIAVPQTSYEQIGQCSTKTCAQPDGTAWYKSLGCNPSGSFKAARCLVDSFHQTQPPLTSMWATGGNDSAIPNMVVMNHTWGGDGVHQYYEVAAIHTAPSGVEPNYDRCSSDGAATGMGSIVIPCNTPNAVDPSIKAKMKAPVPGKIVTTWLQTYSKGNVPMNSNTSIESANGTHGIHASVIIVGAVVGILMVLIAGIWFQRRRKARIVERRIQLESSRYMSSHSTTATGTKRSNSKRGRLNSSHFSQATTVSTTDTGSSTHVSMDSNLAAAYDLTWQILREDVDVSEKQIDYDDIELVEQISGGAHGEVWTGYANQQLVAIKRLLRHKHQNPEDIKAFALEIQLSARLHHPNIVRFVGVACNTLESLVMVMEYLPAGDLSKVLRTLGHKLKWSRHKLNMARGLASAVAYLHTQSPAIIHRDLKSKNVLLNDALEPKLIDFGVSRRKMDETMTSGVGTPFWTAPEVLEGKRYTEKSDIYSLGVLLTEIDTCEMPYHDVKGEEGGMVHMLILNNVMDGTLRPTISPHCPETIRKVIDACLAQNAADRPTAEEVLCMLA